MLSWTATTTSSLNLNHSTATQSSWPHKTENSKENSTPSLRPMMSSEETLTERRRSSKSDSKLMRSSRSQSSTWLPDHQEELDPPSSSRATHLLVLRLNKPHTTNNNNSSVAVTASTTNFTILPTSTEAREKTNNKTSINPNSTIERASSLKAWTSEAHHSEEVN
jgi:hypothetical protein